jgi:predicted CopG family antitoxin
MKQIHSITIEDEDYEKYLIMKKQDKTLSWKKLLIHGIETKFKQ